MDVEKIEFLVTLKTGNVVYAKGTTMELPFPSAVMDEIRAQDPRVPTIRILHRVGGAPVPTAEPKKEKVPAPTPISSEDVKRVLIEDGLVIGAKDGVVITENPDGTRTAKLVLNLAVEFETPQPDTVLKIEPKKKGNRSRRKVGEK